MQEHTPARDVGKQDRFRPAAGAGAGEGSHSRNKNTLPAIPTRTVWNSCNARHRDESVMNKWHQIVQGHVCTFVYCTDCTCILFTVTHLGSTDVPAGRRQEAAIPVAPSVTFLFHMCIGWKTIFEYVERQVCGRWYHSESRFTKNSPWIQNLCVLTYMLWQIPTPPTVSVWGVQPS